MRQRRAAHYPHPTLHSPVDRPAQGDAQELAGRLDLVADQAALGDGVGVDAVRFLGNKREEGEKVE